VLFRDEIRKTLLREFASLADFLRRWTEAERKQAVLDALLGTCADHGIADIEDPKVLGHPPFDRIGSKTRIRRGIFGGSDKFSEALTELERQLYRDSA
jgi:hypothetical protein